MSAAQQHVRGTRRRHDDELGRCSDLGYAHSPDMEVKVRGYEISDLTVEFTAATPRSGPSAPTPTATLS